ncbi:MAG: DNA polymerase IV, partial [Desulfomonilia bacterium]
SYEARTSGIHSAMSSSLAQKLCPDAIFVRPRFDVYQEVSDQIMEIFLEYTDMVEPLSLDEAYLDVTENKKGLESATQIAHEIKEKIMERTGLSASAGVSYNKFLAKSASEYRKPDGLTVIPPSQAHEFIDRLPIGKFYGVGKVTEKKMRTLGIRTGADLKKVSRKKLVRVFGKSGKYFFSIARGCDDRPVAPVQERKSLGKEVTLHEDITDMETILRILGSLAQKVSLILHANDLKGRTITLKIKYHDFKSITRSRTIHENVNSQDIIFRLASGLLKETLAGQKKIRLLGITVANFTRARSRRTFYQLLLPFP